MKNLITIILFLTLTVFAGKLYINFEGGTPTAELEVSEIKNLELIDGSVPAGMAFIQGDTFEMGDYNNEGNSYEQPVHRVSLNDFFIGKYEITQSEWAQYMPADTYDYGVGDDYPVYYASWYAILVYCNKRSIAEDITPCYTISSSTNPDDWGSIPTSSNSTWDAVECNWSANGYRLPTEAEWEYASRGGVNWTDSLRYSGCDYNSDLKFFAWYDINSDDISHPVGMKYPNKMGIFDLSGNIGEWCWDWFATDYYTTCNNLGTVINPIGPENSTNRIIRSGIYRSTEFSCRIANRSSSTPFVVLYSLGFRIARTP